MRNGPTGSSALDDKSPTSSGESESQDCYRNTDDIIISVNRPHTIQLFSKSYRLTRNLSLNSFAVKTIITEIRVMNADEVVQII